MLRNFETDPNAAVSRFASDLFARGRLTILKSLEGRALRFTDLSRQLSMSNGELSRNLRRLSDAGLVDKDASGALRLTPVAHAALSHVAGLGFLEEHRDYFRSHDLSGVPPELMARIGELAGARLLRDAYHVINEIQRHDKAARFRWGFCDLDMLKVIPDPGRRNEELAAWGVDQGVQWRTIASPKDLPVYAAAIRSVAPTVDSPQASGLETIKRMVEFRTLDPFPALLTLSDIGCCLQFPDRTGRVDINAAFVGTTPMMAGWCRDFFEHHWELAAPAYPWQRR